MYAKIQKDMSDNYLLLEAKQIELRNVRCCIELNEYVDNLIIPLNKEFFEEKPISAKVKQILYDLLPAHTIYDNIKVVTEHSCQEDIVYNANLALGCVLADGVPYITCGNIYILNDKGQTIQKI